MSDCPPDRDPTAWAALVTLIVMEVVLGVAIWFVSIIQQKAAAEQRSGARRLGMSMA